MSVSPKYFLFTYMQLSVKFFIIFHYPFYYIFGQWLHGRLKFWVCIIYSCYLYLFILTFKLLLHMQSLDSLTELVESKLQGRQFCWWVQLICVYYTIVSISVGPLECVLIYRVDWKVYGIWVENNPYAITLFFLCNPWEFAFYKWLTCYGSNCNVGCLNWVNFQLVPI